MRLAVSRRRAYTNISDAIADKGAAKYFNRIQKHLDAKEFGFTIYAYSQSFPSSINGIQNGVITYAMNQRKWNANKNMVDHAVESVVSAQSNGKWSSKYICKTVYPEMFAVEYFDAGSAPPADHDRGEVRRG